MEQLTAEAIATQESRQRLKRQFKRLFAAELAELPSSVPFYDAVCWLYGQPILLHEQQWVQRASPLISESLWRAMCLLQQRL
jgi:hypothetical protein